MNDQEQMPVSTTEVPETNSEKPIRFILLFYVIASGLAICDLSNKRFVLREDGGIDEQYLPAYHYAKWLPRRKWNATEIEIALMVDGSELKKDN